MANITPITHGSASWDKDINANFDALNYSTDWVRVPLTNTTDTGLGDYLIFRDTGSRVDIKAQFAVAAAGDITIAQIPENVIKSDWRFLQGISNGHGVVPITIDDKRTMVAHVADGQTKVTIDIDTTIADNALHIH